MIFVQKFNQHNTSHQIWFKTESMKTCVEWKKHAYVDVTSSRAFSGDAVSLVDTTAVCLGPPGLAYHQESET